MPTIEIEWRHLDRDGATCERCGETGESLRDIVAGLQRECSTCGWEIRLKETLLDSGRLGESNQILLNGTPLERILPGAETGSSDCVSCSDLTGQESECRTVVFGRKVYEAIPGQLVREAVCRLAGCC